MNLKRKKARLKSQIEKARDKTMLKEAKLKSKIDTKKEVSELEQELEKAKTIDIPDEDLELIGYNKESGFKSFLLNKAFPALKKAGKDWVERSRAEKAAQRRLNND